MENVIRSRPKRSLFRRLVAPVASLALVSGGGWGAYHYYGSDQVADTQTPLVEAHSAPTAKDELKMLFASSDQPTTVKPEKTKQRITTRPQVDRYSYRKVKPTQLSGAALELPPLVKETKISTKPQAAPANGLGDRYASVATSPTPPTPTVIKKNLKPQQDVARGQEPNSNPLRTASPSPSSGDLDARAAFGAALTQTPKTSSQPATQRPIAPAGRDDLAAALQQARPLQPSQPALATPQTAPAPNRYQSAPPRPTTPSALAQKTRPAPPLEIQSARQPQTPPLGASPLGAPPAGLSAGRTSKAPSHVASRTASPTTRPPLTTSTPPIAATSSLPTGRTQTPGIANHPGTGRPGETLLEGAQSPSITIQKLAPAEIQVGKRCTFAIRVQNSGQRTAQNVQIRDEVPRGTELVGTAPRATVSGGSIVWDLGTLSPGEERTVEMELLPREEGELGSVAMVSMTAQASAKSRCTRPELALRLTSQPQVHVGDQQIVQIEVSNPGSGDATGVMLLETIPAGVSHEAGPALEFEVGTLRAGESRRLELVLTAEQAGRINNVMTARADASLQVEASCEFEIIAPELQLSVEGPQRRFLERPATYRVSINNPGTASAKDVQLVTHLPKGMQFVSANNMGEYDSSTHSVHWSLAELPANERGTVELVALPIESGSQTLQVATKASEGLEDRADKQVLVQGISALTFEVVDVEALIAIGDETTYEIKLKNQGSKEATNVKVVAVMPSGIRPVSGQGETRHTIQGERVVFSPIPQLAPKSETTFRIHAQGVRPGDQRVRVHITSDDTQQPITEEVSTRVYADE